MSTKYTVFAGVTYTRGERQLDEAMYNSKEELLTHIEKIIDGEPDATSLVVTVKIDEESEAKQE